MFYRVLPDRSKQRLEYNETLLTNPLKPLIVLFMPRMLYIYSLFYIVLLGIRYFFSFLSYKEFLFVGNACN